MAESGQSTSSGIESRSPSRSPHARALGVALMLTGLAGLGTWALGIRSMAYDHDEVTKIHSVWLCTQGGVPYRDFMEWHPPYFPILTPFLGRNPIDPIAALWKLRWLSFAGNLLFLGGIAAIGMSAIPSATTARAEGGGPPSASDARRWGLLGVLVVALHPSILTFLVEFRMDGWGYALTTWSICRFLSRPDAVFRSFELGLSSTVAALLLCPKFALLSPLIVAFSLLCSGKSSRQRLAGLVAYIAGVGAACGLFFTYLGWQGIEPRRAYLMVVVYNAVHNANAGYDARLRHSLWENSLLFWMIVAGVAAWGFSLVRGRTGAWRGPLLPAVGVGLVVQAILVAYPFKQYYAPWFLFASVFLFPLGQTLSRLAGRAGALLFVSICAAVLLLDLRLAWTWQALNEAESQRQLIRWMNRVTRPGDHVAAVAPLHPIDRFDVFSLWFSTFDPSGFDGERVLERIPSLHEHATAARFREELENHAPALVVISGDWRVTPRTRGQQAALTEFFGRHPYHAVRIGSAWFALRPDRFELARSARLLNGGG